MLQRLELLEPRWLLQRPLGPDFAFEFGAVSTLLGTSSFIKCLGSAFSGLSVNSDSESNRGWPNPLRSSSAVGGLSHLQGTVAGG